MSISECYLEYLEHFGDTVTVGELHARPEASDLVALRHDVDYDLDLALEMADLEHRHGRRATYYLLHTAEYWHDPQLAEKCLQLQDYHHEVGLHFNGVTDWMAGRVDDLSAHLRELIERLRGFGVDVRGIAAHGDPSCYKEGFTNYWCFQELRPDDPLAEEHGRTAEGIRSEDPRRSIAYPESHELVRGDGRRLSLWGQSLVDIGLEYHAYHVPHDRYFTDSGGRWSRSSDPRDVPLGKGRTQILMHPVYWRGLQRHYLFLSTARSGSKWLANFLDKATNVSARHEFMLNRRMQGGKLTEDRHTGERFAALAAHPEPAEQLILDARLYLDEQPGDQAEVNVYLERFLPQLAAVFPDAVRVHLRRRPLDVAWSLMNREWYDTPGDRRHPAMDVPGWGEMSQFEKVCWYIRKSQDSLSQWTDETLEFEQMIHDLPYLSERLRALGIVVYPRLAAVEHAKHINASRGKLFPKPAEWPAEMTSMFESICCVERPASGLDRPSPVARFARSLGRIGSRLNFFERRRNRAVLADATAQAGAKQPLEIAHFDFHDEVPPGVQTQACTVQPTTNGLVVEPSESTHAHVLFAGGSWSCLGEDDGLPVQPGHYYRGTFDLSVSPPDAVNLFCLMYDRQGKLLGKRNLSRIDSSDVVVESCFRPRPGTVRFNLALFMNETSLPQWIVLRRLAVQRLPLAAPVSTPQKAA